LQKLIACGVPEEQLQEHQEGMLMYMEEHKDKVSEIAAAILSTGNDLAESRKSPRKDDDNNSSNASGDGMYGESLSWLQWMMFDNELDAVLDDMEAGCTEERAVCGSFWG
jgi:E3 ubiquitin-protein ligase UBR3